MLCMRLQSAAGYLAQLSIETENSSPGFVSSHQNLPSAIKGSLLSLVFNPVFVYAVQKTNVSLFPGRFSDLCFYTLVRFRDTSQET